MTKKTCMIVCIALLALSGMLCIVDIGMNHIEQARHRQELSEMYSYEVYTSYMATREAYYVYVMCNPEYTLSDIIAQKLIDQYLISLKSKIDGAETPHAPTEIYLMTPSDELPYGWEKSELNISLNFDRSVFHRHTVCIITIPYGSDSFDDCRVTYRNQSGEW